MLQNDFYAFTVACGRMTQVVEGKWLYPCIDNNGQLDNIIMKK